MDDPEYSADKDVYSYKAPWMIYGLSWSRRCRVSDDNRIVIGSFIEKSHNAIRVLRREADGYKKIGESDQMYPATKIQWNPDTANGSRDLFATSSDHLRLWAVDDALPNGIEISSLLSQKGDDTSKNSYCNPLTSFDWNEADTNVIGTSSIDTTCTIWDIPTGCAKTHLIAHDKEVFDIGFSQNKEIFASVGADGSVRMFDLRTLDHSTILYETPDLVPLLRLAWNKRDANYIATLAVDSIKTLLLDIRLPSAPVAVLEGHGACVNGLSWAPHSSNHICTVADDGQALIWDTSAISNKSMDEPLLAYPANSEINSVEWSAAYPQWVAITFDSTLQTLHL